MLPATFLIAEQEPRVDFYHYSSELGSIDAPSTPSATNKLLQVYAQPIRMASLADDIETSSTPAATENANAEMEAYIARDRDHYTSLFSELEVCLLFSDEDLLYTPSAIRFHCFSSLGRGLEGRRAVGHCRVRKREPQAR